MQDGLRKSYHAQHFTASQQDAWLWLCREAEQGPPSLELMLPLRIPGQRTALPWEYLSKSQICVRDKTELHFKQWIWGGAQDLKFGLESCGLIIP